MLISDWSSDVCSSDLRKRLPARKPPKAKPDGPGPGARLRGHFLSMQLWVGLGNPGAQYALNRHNVGFMAVDAIAEVHGFDPWRSRFQGWTSEGRLGAHKILLLKPSTYMNVSGRSVGEAMRFFKLEPGDVTAFHDELDLAPFRVKVKTGDRKSTRL